MITDDFTHANEKAHTASWRRNFRSIKTYITKLFGVKHILVGLLIDRKPQYQVVRQNLVRLQIFQNITTEFVLRKAVLPPTNPRFLGP